MAPRLRYVHLPDHPTITQIDAALISLRQRRNTTKLAVVRSWVDAEIDIALDMRTAAELEQHFHHPDLDMCLTQT